MPDKRIQLENLNVAELPAALGICEACRLDRQSYTTLAGGWACFCSHNKAGGFFSIVRERWVLYSPIAEPEFIDLITTNDARVQAMRQRNRIFDS